MRICSESAVFPCLTDQSLPRIVRSFDNKKALVLATLSGEYMLQVERNTARRGSPTSHTRIGYPYTTSVYEYSPGCGARYEVSQSADTAIASTSSSISG